MNVSSEIATHPKPSKSRNSDVLVSRSTNSNQNFGLISICTEEFEFLDLVDCGREAFSDETVRYILCEIE